jgi:hypothetical protein
MHPALGPPPAATAATFALATLACSGLMAKLEHGLVEDPIAVHAAGWQLATVLVDCDVDQVYIGMPVEVVFEPTGEA